MVPYAGFWIRFVAYLIDAIILNVAGGLLGGLLGLGMGLGMGMAGTDSETIAGASALTGGLLGFLLSFLYFAILESSSWQGTVGKKALGIAVTDLNGNRLTFGRATGRFFGKILSSITLLIGYMMAGWTERKQGLHDMVAGTLCYRTREPQQLQDSAEVFA